MSDLKDKVIGGFRVLREIQAGSGSQGTVYKAICVDVKDNLVPVNTVVALKVMAVQDEGREQWRKLEKRTAELARMDSPNVVKYYGCFSEAGLFNDVHVIVQEFLQGETLKERLVRFPSGLDVDEALKIANAAISGLVYTTRCGIIHRDIKPGNIFLCDNGAVKLIDFEIARQSGGTTTSSAGNIRGSFDYMAPDFTDADFHGDVQSDVFSMGVVLHEMLSGKTPYQRLEGGDKQANFAFLSRWAHSLTDGYNPIRISSRISRLLAHTEDVMARALAPRREDRYPDFEAFQAGLKAIRFRNLRNGQNSYQMLQFIGKGGFGEVFKARMGQAGRLVAVKHLLKANYAERFYREAKIMKKLNDPSFVQLVDFFMMEVGTNREAFLVMAFLDGMPGSSLRDAIRNAGERRLPAHDVFRAFERYARGLQVMHAEGIFHRDIKPSNLYYPAGRPEAAAIMDLGIARDVNGTATHGQVPGTLDYMPPEVVMTDNRGDAGMDIYALGLCFYEALTSKMAFPRLPTGSATYAAFFDRARAKRKPVFDDAAVVADPELTALLTDMTNPELSLRIQDARILVERLGELRKRRFPESDGDDGATVAADGATQGTVFAQWGNDQLEALERERERIRVKRRDVRGVFTKRTLWGALVGVCSLILVVAAVFLWNSRVRYATDQLDEILRDYQSGKRDRALTNETAWRAQWSPEAHNWIKLDDAAYGKLVNRLDAEKRRAADAESDKRRQRVLDQIADCKASSGELDEQKFLKLSKQGLPEGAGDDAEIGRYLQSLGGGLEAAILKKLKTEPPRTRRLRLETARNLLDCPLAARVLPKDKRNELREKIADAAGWRVGIVKNNCGADVILDLDNRTIPDGGAAVAVCKDGRPESHLVKRKGYEPIHLPEDLEGRTFEIAENMFSVKVAPAPVPSPQPDEPPLPPKNLKMLRDTVLSQCRGLMAVEPIDTRQDRLAEALKMLKKAIETDRILTADDSMAIETEIRRQQRWVAGKIRNGFRTVVLTVADRSIKPGQSELFTFRDGLPGDWSCTAPDYEKKDLPRDFDGRVIVLGEGDLKALPPAPAPAVSAVAAKTNGTQKRTPDQRRDLVRRLASGSEFLPNPPKRAAGDRMSLQLPNGPLMEFVWCPPGRFLMGSPEGEAHREGGELQHLVTLTNGFWIGAKEVTREQWKSVMTNARWMVSSVFGNDQLYPIDDVTWHECREFCRRVSRKMKRTMRLPTEAEWEYACRAGTATPFSFGSSLNGAQACCRGESDPYGSDKSAVKLLPKDHSGTVFVGSFQRNPWGIYDMHGNVYEWCMDWYEKYGPDDVIDPRGPEAGASRVIRGGCWNFGAKFCRSAYRGRKPPNLKDDLTGFRVCVEDEEEVASPARQGKRPF